MKFTQKEMNFIKDKMKKLESTQRVLRAEITIIDRALFDKEIRYQLSLDEIHECEEIMHNKCLELKRVKYQYKNLNQIRLHMLGLA